MTDKQINSIINIVYVVSSIMVIIGAILKIQHSPNGLSILIIGFILGTITSSFDTYRLKQKIKRLEELIKLK
jgi:predicted ABC-type exoprotein transport system permease subunit